MASSSKRAESKYSIKQVCVIVEFYGDKLNGDKLNGVSYSDSATMKKYVRRAQLGEIFKLGHAIWNQKSDDIFRSKPRDWFTFGQIYFICSYIHFRAHLAWTHCVSPSQVFAMMGTRACIRPSKATNYCCCLAGVYAYMGPISTRERKRIPQFKLFFMFRIFLLNKIIYLFICNI